MNPGNLPNVMVAGAHSMGALGVIRSLGKAGYIVHAVSAIPDAIGLRSNFALYSELHPDSNAPEFEEWFTRYISTYGIKLIIPGAHISPGSHPVISRYMHLFPVANDRDILAKSRKFELFESFSSKPGKQTENLPPLILVNLKQDIASINTLSELGPPLFIKLDGAHATNNQTDQVIRLDNANDALICLKQLTTGYSRAVVQGYVAGSGVGVFILRWNGRTVAKFMHRRLHEMPHTGGASSLRESWWHEEIFRDAEEKLSFINWQGVAMIEYRWNPATDEFYLMEMNLRFWGSIHLAIYSGIDFPKLLADSFFNYKVTVDPSPIIGLKCRNTIPFEIGYLVSLLRDPNVPVLRKLHSIWEALFLSLDFRVKNDLLFPGDRKLFWYRLGKFIRTGQ